MAPIPARSVVARCGRPKTTGRTIAIMCRYRQDLIETAMVVTFGLGWLEARLRRKATGVKSRENQLAKLREREKRLAGPLKELDDEQMFDTVMTQLRELRSQVCTGGQAQAAQQQAAVDQPIKIRDATDRAMIAFVLKQQLGRVTFGDDHHVLLVTAAGYVLTVIATYQRTSDA